MAKVVKVKSTLQDAANVKTVWESNPDLKFGKVGLNDFITVYNEAEELDKTYAKKYAELSGALAKRDDKSRELQSLVVRFRKGIVAHFGADSPEYGQAGGTRESQRKSPARKSKPASTDNPAAEPPA